MNNALVASDVGRSKTIVLPSRRTSGELSCQPRSRKSSCGRPPATGTFQIDEAIAGLGKGGGRT